MPSHLPSEELKIEPPIAELTTITSSDPANRGLNFAYDTILSDFDKLSRARIPISKNGKSQKSTFKQQTVATTTNEPSDDSKLKSDFELASIKRDNDQLIAQLVDSVRSTDKMNFITETNDVDAARTHVDVETGDVDDDDDDDNDNAYQNSLDSKRLIHKTIKEWTLFGPATMSRNLFRSRIHSRQSFTINKDR